MDINHPFSTSLFFKLGFEDIGLLRRRSVKVETGDTVAQTFPICLLVMEADTVAAKQETILSVTLSQVIT